MAEPTTGDAGPGTTPPGDATTAGSSPDGSSPAGRDGTGPAGTRWQPGPELDAVAHLDHDRAARRGYPEAVLCEPKSVAQVAAIADQVARAGTPTLFTRAEPDQARALLAALPDAAHHEDARLVAWPAEPPAPTGGTVVGRGAGPAARPVAR
ncbi:MAG: hypothetical protein ACTHXO_09340, partial [Actinomycetaceae bacterium]